MSDLRDRVVEAGARRLHPVAWQKPHNLREAEAALDAFLDCLTENADEWASKSIDVWADMDNLIAVLRNPAEETDTP